ncbi:ribonuclease H-like domain-containing protein, partial [Tanacetum coccineum]
DHPLKHMEHRGIFDSGCSGHMTGNRAHLEDYQELSKVLLKVPRQHNMYTFDMKTVDSSKGYTCLLAKASSDEAKLWHKRLGHLNFKNLNKLVTDNLVRGLPSKSFKNDHTCVACQKGKQHKASCKAKIDRSDNGTEFKNTVMLEFCGEKGIKQEFSNVRTPQQNGVAERMNRTLIEAEPPGFVDPDHPTKVYKVVKALYGLHQASRAWYATLSTFLEQHGYKRGTIDKTLFIIRKETKGKKVVSSLDFQEEVDDVAEQVNTAGEVNIAGEINTAGEEVNTVSKINTGSVKLNTGTEGASTVGEDKGQREGKAPMLSKETPKK